MTAHTFLLKNPIGFLSLIVATLLVSELAFAVPANWFDAAEVTGTILPSSFDVAITRIAQYKTVVGHGFNMTVNVTVKNEGNSVETLTIQVYANGEVSGILAISNMSEGTSMMLTLTWNTTSLAKGNYTVSAYVEPVPGEIHVADNNITDGWVYITIPGDVTSNIGSPDGRVDMRDIGVICRRFGATASSPDWNPNMDINDDGTINMWDIGIACNNFAKT